LPTKLLQALDLLVDVLALGSGKLATKCGSWCDRVCRIDAGDSNITARQAERVYPPLARPLDTRA
jgi:hypothetical protein